MKNKSLISVMAVTMLIVCSCKKEKTNLIPAPAGSNSYHPPVYSGTSDFFEQNSVPDQLFNVNGTSGGTFTGTHGTKFTIPPAAFVDQNNQPVTGNISINIKEIYSKREMFLSKVMTTSYGYPLLSAGMFSFEPALNGVELKFAPGKKMQAEVPADSINMNMIAFMGIAGDIDIDADGVADANGVNWNAVDSGGFGSFNYDNIIPYNYVFIDDSTGWHNVDAFYWSPADISITVNTLNNPNPDSTFTCVWFTGFNAIWELYQNSTDHSKFESNHVKPVPVSLIAISIHNNKIYADISTISSLTANGVYDLTMHEMTDEALKAALSALN